MPRYTKRGRQRQNIEVVKAIATKQSLLVWFFGGKAKAEQNAQQAQTDADQPVAPTKTTRGDQGKKKIG